MHGKSIYVFVIWFSMLEQVLCFVPETNSIFASEKLLTLANNNFDMDQTMFKILGLIPNALSFC
jgi:biotin synthase